MLTILSVAAVIALVVALQQRRRRNAYKHAALGLLDKLRDCADQDLPSETNRLLKRVALVAFPNERTRINQLFGNAWVDWLNSRCGKSTFIGASADALAHGGYRAAAPCPRDELMASTRRWLLDHRRQPAVYGSAARV